jgi:hypothetical protein
MTDNNTAPYGWTALDPESVSYDFGEARFGKGPNDIPVNDTGTDGKSQEDEYHSVDVSPDSAGVAKTGGGEKSSYGGTDDYRPEAGSKDPGDTGSLDLPVGHVVVENGMASSRNYYLVQDIKTEKYYTVVPNYKDGQQYKSPMRADRTSALADAYRVLSASLPDSALAQLRERFPETLALNNV